MQALKAFLGRRWPGGAGGDRPAYSISLGQSFLLYNIMELQSPGALRRMESRMKKDKNQRFYIRPSRVIPRGGSINIGEILKNMTKEATR